MKKGDTVFYIENREIREAELLDYRGGFVTLRYRTLCPELLGGQSLYLCRGIRLPSSRIFSTLKQAEIALERYRKTWR